MMISLFAALALLPSCKDKEEGGEDSEVEALPDRGPDPWEGMSAIPLDPFRLLFTRELEGAVAPARILPIERRSLTGVLDLEAGAVHVLDARYHHHGYPQCVDLDYFDGFEAGDRQGECAEGSVEISRGHLEPEFRLGIAAADPEGLAFYGVDRDGLLSRAEADVLAGDPFDYLRLSPVAALEDPPDFNEDALALVADGSFFLAHGAVLSRYSLEGALESRIALPGTASDLRWFGGGIWAATDGGLLTAEGDVLELSAARLAVMGEAIWASLPESDEIVRIQGGEQQRFPADGALAALAADTSAGKLYLGTTTGVTVFDAAGAELARYEVGATADIDVTATHEIRVLSAEGLLSVYLDEEPLAAGEALDFVLVTFMEKPRSPDEELPCRDEEQSVQSNVARARTNLPLVEDLPAPAALAITPHAARRIPECGEEATFRLVWDNDFVEHGVLFHQEYVGCGDDLDCHETELARDYSDALALGIEPTWVTGLSPHVTAGLDWAKAIVELDLPNRYVFFGMSILSQISHHTDPRGKEPYPVDAEEVSAAWRVSAATETDPGDPDGPVWLYPGDSVAAFTQGGCPNVFIQECRLVGGGGGQDLDAEDLAVLQVLLHRALAARQDGVVDTWSFHLPDLGAFDYVSGCEEEARIWSGADCQAALLQSWMLDLHQRFVLNGLMRWSRPSELAEP